MHTHSLLLFALTALPPVFTPGPDLIFIASQGLSSGPSAALRANAGILLGYVAHAILAAFGVAAIVAAFPILFEALRWIGVAYLAFIALQMIRSALRPGGLSLTRATGHALLRRGFLTSFLNPKGLLMYFAILPNFIEPATIWRYRRRRSLPSSSSSAVLSTASSASPSHRSAGTAA